MRGSLAALHRHIDCEFHYRMQTSFLWNNRHQSAREQNKYTKQTVLTLQRLRSFSVQSVAFNNTRATWKKKKREKSTNKLFWELDATLRGSEERGRRRGGRKKKTKKKRGWGVLEGVDIFPDFENANNVERRGGRRQRPDTAQPGDPMPIGAWPFSRVLCQRCQFDGRRRPKWHFSRVGKRGGTKSARHHRLLKRKRLKKHGKSIHKHKGDEGKMVVFMSILCYFPSWEVYSNVLFL